MNVSVTICGAFQAAMAEYKYEGRYCPVYPIKVNQVRHVVDVISEAGRPFAMGLEVGSKPELVAVLAIQDTPDALLVCNGYKDRRYIELALLARRVGRRPIIVIEKRPRSRWSSSGRRRAGGRAGDRLPAAHRRQGRRALGAQRRRARKVRPHRPGDRQRAGLPARARQARLKSACCTSTSAAS
jgi:hypothetical protein